MSDQRPGVIFILSTNYAGSHLLTQLLGAHPQCRSIGELHNYRKYQDRPDERHSVVNDFADNPWFSGLDSLPPSSWHGQVLQAVRAGAPEVSVLVDNSKKPAWAERFIDNPDFDAHFVHLIRDPRALVRRWQQTYDTPQARRAQRRRIFRHNPRCLFTALFGTELELYCAKWLQANQEISRFLSSVGQSANLVTYHDLALHTRTALERLMPCMGMDFRTEQLNFGAVEHRGTLKKAYLEQSRRSEIQLDNRWKQALSVDEVRRITSNRPLCHYVSELGLSWAEDGLTAEKSI